MYVDVIKLTKFKFYLIKEHQTVEPKITRESHSVIFEATRLEASMSNFEPTRSYNRCSDQICLGLPTKPVLFLGWKRRNILVCRHVLLSTELFRDQIFAPLYMLVFVKLIRKF